MLTQNTNKQPAHFCLSISSQHVPSLNFSPGHQPALVISTARPSLRNGIVGPRVLEQPSTPAACVPSPLSSACQGTGTSLPAAAGAPAATNPRAQATAPLAQRRGTAIPAATLSLSPLTPVLCPAPIDSPAADLSKLCCAPACSSHHHPGARTLQSGFNTGLTRVRPFLSGAAHRPQTATALRLQGGDGAVPPVRQGAGFARVQDRARSGHCLAPAGRQSPAARTTAAGKSIRDCSWTERLLGTRSLFCHRQEQGVLQPLLRGCFPSLGAVGAALPQKQLLLRAGGRGRRPPNIITREQPSGFGLRVCPAWHTTFTISWARGNPGRVGT